LFRNWLTQLQDAFDDDMSAGSIHERGWHANASSDGVLVSSVFTTRNLQS